MGGGGGGAADSGRPVWVVAGIGRVLPPGLWDAAVDRYSPAEPWDGDEELVPLRLVDEVIGPDGPEPPRRPWPSRLTPRAELTRRGSTPGSELGG